MSKNKCKNNVDNIIQNNYLACMETALLIISAEQRRAMQRIGETSMKDASQTTANDLAAALSGCANAIRQKPYLGRFSPIPFRMPTIIAGVRYEWTDEVANKPWMAERVDKQYDWEPTGYGATESAAFDDLLDKEAAEAMEDQ